MTFTDEQQRKLAVAQEILGYRFADEQLLLSAITHPSATEGKSVKYSYERLEFLGDSILGVAERLGFADVIVFGSSETGTGRRGLHSALENVYEAVVAALFLDGGIEAAEGFVRATLIPRMSADMAREPENPKSALQEKLQEDGITPTYKLVETQGPPHDRTFVAQVFAGSQGLARGTGRTKKEAESQAAKSTLARLGEFFGLGVDGEARAEKAEAAKQAKAEKAAARAEEKARKKSERERAKQRKQG